MGRNSATWGEDSLEFRPERWLEMSKRPTAFEFPNFQVGPPICLGMTMAILEAKYFIATTLRRFHIENAPSDKYERGYVLKTAFFLDGGLPLHLNPQPQHHFQLNAHSSH
ncbi:Cytochrome P450 [Phytophthora megakarya]|uniref:Cytochrome P450 n=1 Tax=Phytophthora megakarya TaxID=4795 RepID=A0A225UHM4_9STRA|nr:Cytochrome P450 [Phytophthora megakarya]